MKKYIILLLIVSFILSDTIFARIFVLRWGESTDIEHYEVEFSLEKSFSKPIIKNITASFIEIDSNEILNQLGAEKETTFYVRCKAVFKTGQGVSYTSVREITVQKAFYGIFHNPDGKIYLPEKFQLNFLKEMFQKDLLANKSLFFKLEGKKSKLFQYETGKYVTFKGISGPREILFYFADASNTNPSPWQRINVVYDIDPPVLEVKVLSSIQQNDGSFKVKATDIVEIQAKDELSGINFSNSIFYSIDQSNPPDKKLYIQYKGPICISDLLSSIKSENNNEITQFTLFYKAFDNVGNESKLNEVRFIISN